MNDVKLRVLSLILDERTRQDAKWGAQNHSPALWATLLGEEYGEFCEAVNETVFEHGIHRERGGHENMLRELTHVAAVAVQAMECLLRQKSE